MEERPDGILIRSANEVISFQKSVDELRQYKSEIYIRIESQANEPETIGYYKKAGNDLSDIDLDIIEE